MNQVQFLSLLRTFLKTVGGAVGGYGYVSDSNIELIIGIILAVAGAVWSHYSKEKKPTDGPTGPALPIVAVTLCLLFTSFIATGVGCATLQTEPAKMVLRVGLKIATYEIAAKNPELRPYIESFANVLTDVNSAVAPTALNELVKGAVNSHVSDPVHRLALDDLTAVALSFYTEAYERYSDDLSNEELQALLTAMGQSIRAGLYPTVANGSFVLSTSEAQLIVE